MEELLNFATNSGSCLMKRKRFITISHGLIWNLWKYWNDLVFNGVFLTPTNSSGAIKSLVFFWKKCRGKSGLCEWKDWVLLHFTLSIIVSHFLQLSFPFVCFPILLSFPRQFLASRGFFNTICRFQKNERIQATNNTSMKNNTHMPHIGMDKCWSLTIAWNG